MTLSYLLWGGSRSTVAKNPLQDFWAKRGGGRLFDMGGSTVIYGNGDGCRLTDFCCSLNNPPRFCIPPHSSEDIEMRICCDNKNLISNYYAIKSCVLNYQ